MRKREKETFLTYENYIYAFNCAEQNASFRDEIPLMTANHNTSYIKNEESEILYFNFFFDLKNIIQI